jgi:hypothetical protein
MSDSAKRQDRPERRRASRIALRLSATIRETNRGRVQARLIDISTHGCRVEAISGASPDAWLWLSIAGLETQYCRVVWHCEEFVGLEFATPLAEAVLDRLLQDQKHLSEATIGELRDIAVRTHRLATKQADADIQTLAELSHTCAIEAVIEGFRLSEAGQAEPGNAAEPPSPQ